MRFVFQREDLCFEFVLDESTILAEFRQIFSAAGFVTSVIDDEFGEMGLAGV